MLNEFAYCPRLFYLEHVEQEFEDNAFTVEGRLAHRRVDVKGGQVPSPEEDRPFTARAVELSSAQLGISAKIDLVDGEGGRVEPVDYKRGRPPENAQRSWEPERIQLCAYGLLLREHGYTCDRGILYFAESKTRVPVPFDDLLVERTRQVIRDARATALAGRIPPPLKASPKCEGCSLHAICLPDEVNAIADSAHGEERPVRHFVPSRDDARPLYVSEQGAKVGISGEVLVVTGRDRQELARTRLLDVSQVVLMGNVQVSAQAARELMGRNVPICWMTHGGWLVGLSEGLGHGNVELRRAQFRAAEDEATSLRLSKRLVRAKILNCRTLLRRNHERVPEAGLRELSAMAEACEQAASAEALLGVEGNAARVYFREFAGMIREPARSGMEFDFSCRTRRPPKDPVNALLSFVYALLAREVAVALKITGFDPLLGFYHRPRFGRPALALDVMEELRPLLADSTVITAINTGVVRGRDFVRSTLGVALRDEARREVIRAWERRLREEVTHPVFGYRVSYRRVIEIQARLLARHLLGEIPEYPELRTR
ncbi:MAG: CRISPR-associated endonuclease Cas1 [Myxococcaceae bacterium]|nr:CRISPR-associated endonuclease Cas1 [Myxococcaceae bacterium]